MSAEEGVALADDLAAANADAAAQDRAEREAVFGRLVLDAPPYMTVEPFRRGVVVGGYVDDTDNPQVFVAWFAHGTDEPEVDLAYVADLRVLDPSQPEARAYPPEVRGA